MKIFFLVFFFLYEMGVVTSQSSFRYECKYPSLGMKNEE